MILLMCDQWSLSTLTIRDYRQHGSGSNATVPIGLEMMSPESPPDENDDDGWSSGEFSDSDEETRKDHISPIEVSIEL